MIQYVIINAKITVATMDYPKRCHKTRSLKQKLKMNPL